jgi:uncharacterized protein (TIGR03435 family)
MRHLLLLLLTALTSGQDAYRFEAVAIRPAALRVQHPDFQGPNDEGLYTAPGRTIQDLLGFAFGRAYTVEVNAHRFPFVSSEAYSISARIPEGVGRSKIPEMLQALLEERFGLEYHIETRERDGFNIVLLNLADLQHKAANYEREHFMEHLPPGALDHSRNYFSASRISMPELGHALESVVGSPVADQTRIVGTFTFWIEMAQDGVGGLTSETVESLRGYGLKLQKARLTVRYLVVDKITKTAEN